MRLGFRIAALALWVLAACTTLGDRSWSRVRSPHFELYTDGSVDKGRERLEVLETFRSFVAGYTNATLSEDLPRLRVIAPGTFERYETLRPSQSDVVGYYRSTRYGPVAVFSLDGDPTEALEVALHEYVHHIQFQGSAPPMPAWYREGLAEYLGSFVLDRQGRVVLGRPLEGRSSWLVFSKNWVDFDRVVSGDFDPNEVDNQLFYAQAWIMTHYLVNHDRERLQKYVEAYAQDPKSDPFEEVFGESPRSFGRRVRAYLVQGKLPARVYERPKTPAAFEVTAVPDEERDYLLAHLGVGRLSLERMRTLMELQPASALVRLALAEAYYAEGQLDEALAEVEALVAARGGAPTPRARSTEALIRVRQAEALPTDAPARAEGLAAALEAALAANRENPEDVVAFEVLARVGLAGGELSAANALAAVETAQVLAPHRDDLVLIEANYRAGHDDPAGARALAERLQRISLRPSVREAATKLLERLDEASP